MKKHAEFKNLHIVDHPLIQHKLTRMRDESCESGEFRRLLKEISQLMGYEVTRNLPIKNKLIKTPMQEMNAPTLDGPLPVVVPILRAGLGMADGLVELIPECHIGHIGVYRDETTHRPVEYLVRLPKSHEGIFIVTDPMLATGYSAQHVFDVLIREGVPASNIIFMCLVSVPEGVRVLEQRHGNIPVYTASLDECLNEKAYILPGLGDAGDRLFGTF